MQFNIYQCDRKTILSFGYDRFVFYKTQIIKTNNQEVDNVLKSHSNFKLLKTSHKLLRLAPELHQIKPGLENPQYMRKEDIINEILSYGVKPDYYALTNTLAFQLQTLRTLVKRSNVTVLNNKGMPVYIEELRLENYNLSDEERKTLEERPESIKKAKKIEHSYVELSMKKGDNGYVEGTTASIEVEPDVPQYEGIDKDIMGFISDLTQKVEIEELGTDVQREMKNFTFKNNFEKVEDGTVQKEFPEIDIKFDNFRYLVEPQEGVFCFKDISEEERVKIRITNYLKMPQDVMTRFIQVNNIDTSTIKDGPEKRSTMITAIKRFIDNSNEREKHNIEMNLLEKRFREIEDLEPDFKRATNSLMERNIRYLKRYGLNILWTKEKITRPQMIKLCRAHYTIAKKGLQIPETIEEINDLEL
jgi:hypothetical protein